METPWEDQARKMQQHFYNNLSDRDWDCFKSNEHVYLLQNIGFALHGPPVEQLEPANKNTGYTTEQLQKIEDLCKKIKENDCHTRMKIATMNNIAELLEKYCVKEQLSLQEYINRDFYISEICNLIDSYDENNSKMVNKMRCDIVSALNCISISEDTFLNKLYSKKILEEIKDIYEEVLSIINQYRGTLMSVIFVITRVEFEKTCFAVPEAVFRVPNDGDGIDGVRFIDRNQRVYRGWEQYLAENKLQEGHYCYPASGMYDGDENYEVQVVFGETPASKLINRALNTGDVISTTVGAGVSVFGIGALLIPAIAAPVLVQAAAIGATLVGLYSVGRGIGGIVDRRKHDEDIGLKNSDARNVYLSIVGSSMGIFAMGATGLMAKLVKNGRVIGAFGQFVVNALQISSMGVNGFGIATTAYTMRRKYLEGTLTTLDVFQFSSNVLFFSMSAVNFRTAKTIIVETQEATLNDFRSNLRSNRHRKGFDKLSRNSRQGSPIMEGNAKIIRSISRISSPDEFFAGVVRINKHHAHGTTKMRFGDKAGVVSINDAVKVEPTAFASMNKADRINVINATNNLKRGILNRQGFDKLMVHISTKNGLAFKNNLVIAESTICNAFGASSLQEIDANENGMCFCNLSENGLLKTAKVISDPNVTREIVRISAKLFNTLWEGALPKDFDIRLEFTIIFFAKQVKILEDAYQLALRAVMNRSHFNQEIFDEDYGIIGDRMQYFADCVERLYSVFKYVYQFREEYEKYRKSKGT